MTIKEKFNALVPKEFGGMQEPLLNECEKIADDYAIEFVNWIMFTDYSTIDNTTKELLEIFKKEKGL